jgi:type IV pilus assembly protein PilB
LLRGKRIGDLLIDAGLLTDDQLRQALEQQRKEREPLKLGELLVRRGFVREESLAEALSRQLAIDRYAPDRYPIDMSLTSLIPAEEAQRLQVVPLRKSGTLLIVAVADPTDIQTLDALEAMTDLEVEPVICTRSELTQLMSGVYGMSVGLGGILEKLGDVEYSEEKGEEEGQALQVSSLLDIAECAW